MRYEFLLEDYYDTMDIIYDTNAQKGLFDFKQIKIAEDGDIELYVFGYRVVIPEIKCSIRAGIEYYVNGSGEEEPVDVFVFYVGNEKDPLQFTDSYCNTTLASIVKMRASIGCENVELKCYIDDEEFVFFED